MKQSAFHSPSSYIRRLVLYLVLLYLSKTADWQSKARVKINFTIRERFLKLIMDPGRASSIFFNLYVIQNLYTKVRSKDHHLENTFLLQYVQVGHGIFENCGRDAITVVMATLAAT